MYPKDCAKAFEVLMQERLIRTLIVAAMASARNAVM